MVCMDCIVESSTCLRSSIAVPQVHGQASAAALPTQTRLRIAFVVRVSLRSDTRQ